MRTFSSKVHRLRHSPPPWPIFTKAQESCASPRVLSRRCTSLRTPRGTCFSAPPWGKGGSPEKRSYTRAGCLRLRDGRGVIRAIETQPEGQDNHQIELQTLERARVFGITSFEELLHQSTFEHILFDHNHLVYREEYRDNLELWCILLLFQKARFGVAGVKKTWHFMKDRVGMSDEFFKGPISDEIWPVLISAGLEDHKFLRQLCRHEKALTARRPTLYLEVVGGLLGIDQTSMAYHFSQRLQTSHTVGDDDVHELFLQACDINTAKALHNFRAVLNTLPDTHIYSRVVPFLCNQDRLSEAWEMHNCLLSRGDLPPDFESVMPLIRHIEANGISFEEFLQGLKKANVSLEGQARRLHRHVKSLRYGFATDTMNVVSSKTLGLRPTKLSDEFVSRAFATRAFSFDFVFSGLVLLGLQEIGPLALRQLALGAADPSELNRRLALLRDADVDCGSSMYARVLKKLASQKKSALLSDILDSDQHPDVFEDFGLQEKLLMQYYRNCDWRQVNRTVAILAIGTQSNPQNESLSEQEAAYNVLLQCALRVADRPGITRLMGQAHDHGWRLTQISVRSMYDNILLARKSTLKPLVDEEFDDIGFLISLWQTAIEAGSHIPPYAWREPIRRLGMLRRWTDLERLLFWLAGKYSNTTIAGQGSSISASAQATYLTEWTPVRRPSFLETMPALEIIFREPLQRALIAWGFQSPLPPQVLPEASLALKSEKGSQAVSIPWNRGVWILRQLQRVYHVPVRISLVREVCLQRLRILFSPNYYPNRLINRAIRRNNRIPLEEYLKQLDHAWGGTLFPRSMTTRQRILNSKRVSAAQVHQPCLPRVECLGRQMGKRRVQRSNRLARMREHWVQTANASLLARNKEPKREHRDVAEHLNLDKPEEPEEDVVVYEDLFNASWRDYQKR